MSKRRRVDEPLAEETTETRNAARRQVVAARLAEQLQHGGLDAALTDLQAIVASCDAVGVEFAMFAGLDELMQSMEQDEDVGAVIEVEGEGKAAALALVGRYCQLWERPALALGHFNAAMETYTEGELPERSPGAMGLSQAESERRGVVWNQAALGRSQCKATLGQRQQAFDECLESASALHVGWRDSNGEFSTASVQFVFLLAELAAAQPVPPALRVCEVLGHLQPMLGSAANFALEPLARLWLPSLIAPSRENDSPALPTAALEPFVLAALRDSRTFASLQLEGVICEYRQRLLLHFSAKPSAADDRYPLKFAAAIACHQAFCGWPRAAPPAGLLQGHQKTVSALGETWRSDRITRAMGASDMPTDAGERWQQLTSVLTVAMHGPLLGAAARGIERWWRALQKADDTLNEVVESVDEMVKVLILDPQREHDWSRSSSYNELKPTVEAEKEAEKEAAAALDEPLQHSVGAVEEFYDSMVYPPWHACEAVGLSPLPITARIRQQDPSFTWPHGEGGAGQGGADTHRVLIAGCGSGHQLALTRQLLTAVHIVGLDLSRRALGYASRRLEVKEQPEQPEGGSSLPETLTTTIALLHGDIMDLCPERIQPFEIVCCGGVLHHLPDPPAGLKALRSVLKTGGVLQLATYSTIGTAAWRKDAAEYLPTSPAVGHLYPVAVTATRFAPIRAPSHEELQAFRAELLALAGPDGRGLRQDLAGERLACHAVQCGFEFFSSAGLRDLLFHPQERTYTLLELKELLADCGLECFGVTFGSLGADAVARTACRCTRAIATT